MPPPKSRKRSKSLPKDSPSSVDKSPARKKTKASNKKEKEKEIIRICGGYTPIKKLGEGAYGVTWKAKKGFKNYAVKITTPKEVAPGLPLYSHDIIKEIDLFTRLRHPNVMESSNQIYISGSQICYFMPLMGPTFKTVCDDFIPEGRMPYISMEWKYSAYRKMLCGLAYLHANFVIHCDLKPENVMYNEETANVRIIDYGLAVIFGSTGKVKYDSPTITPRWRPPELFAMEISDRLENKNNIFVKSPSDYYYGPEVDVYSMGWIGMELFYGVSPPYHRLPEEMLITLVAMGCSPGPDFVLNYQGSIFGSRLSSSDSNYFQGMVAEHGDHLLNIYKPNPNYLAKVSGESDSELLTSYIPYLTRMITSPPLRRPTAQYLVDFFPPTLSREPCEKITISYPSFQPIEYSSPYFTPEVREFGVTWITQKISRLSEEVGEDNLDSVILEAIDLYDRISMIIPPPKELKRGDNTKLNAAVALYLAVQLMTSWGLKFVNTAMEVGTDPITFSQRVTEVIVKLKSRLFRPTLDQYTDLSTQEALNVLMKNLSPSGVSSVSSIQEVESRYESGREPEKQGILSWLPF